MREILRGLLSLAETPHGFEQNANTRARQRPRQVIDVIHDRRGEAHGPGETRAVPRKQSNGRMLSPLVSDGRSGKHQYRRARAANNRLAPMAAKRAVVHAADALPAGSAGSVGDQASAPGRGAADGPGPQKRRGQAPARRRRCAREKTQHIGKHRVSQCIGETKTCRPKTGCHSCCRCYWPRHSQQMSMHLAR